MNDSYFTAFLAIRGCFGGLLIGLISESGILLMLAGAVGESFDPWWNPDTEGLNPVTWPVESNALDFLGSLLVGSLSSIAISETNRLVNAIS